jgi:hypothetical protein
MMYEMCLKTFVDCIFLCSCPCCFRESTTRNRQVVTATCNMQWRTHVEAFIPKQLPVQHGMHDSVQRPPLLCAVAFWATSSSRSFNLSQTPWLSHRRGANLNLFWFSSGSQNHFICNTFWFASCSQTHSILTKATGMSETMAIPVISSIMQQSTST